MKNRYFLALLVIPAVILLTRFINLSTSATTQRSFVAHLSGDKEVPAVMAQGQGMVTFQLNEDGTALSYKLTVADIEHVTHMHLHLGAAGENGPPIAPLHAHHGTTHHGNSMHVDGVLRARDLMGPLAGSASLTPLLEAMTSGKAYANIHTETNPRGELRGQVSLPPEE